jgi:hypothetical protein
MHFCCLCRPQAIFLCYFFVRIDTGRLRQTTCAICQVQHSTIRFCSIVASQWFVVIGRDVIFLYSETGKDSARFRSPLG